MLKYLYFITTLLSVIIICNAHKCIPRKFQFNSFVCVCNSTYCDTIEPLPENLNSTQYVTYTSTRSHERMTQNIGQFQMDVGMKSHTITINHQIKYQTIMGFGGAMTDATGINIASLSKPTQDLLMQQYFGNDGLQYTILRVPVAGTDFSTRTYTYDDVPNDITFDYFQLAEEDIKYKIPYLRQAMNLSQTYPIRLIGCSWSAPVYMKDSNDYIGGSRLLDKYYPIYAIYLTKFLQAYKNEGFDFYLMSGGNEPVIGGINGYDFNGMGFNAYSAARFIGNYLGPTMEQNGFGHVKIITGDDQRPFMYRWTQVFLQNENASKYVVGIGVHWYMDDAIPPEIITEIHNLPEFENRFILYTEACQGSKENEHKVQLGSWNYGTGYLNNIIDDLNNWSVGWLDWNLALNEQGGPNWAKNFVDSPIIVNAEKDEFYKNPMYYALAHVTKFILPESVRIHMENENHSVNGMAFETPNNNTVVVLYNKREQMATISIKDTAKDGIIQLNMEPKSMVTVIY